MLRGVLLVPMLQSSSKPLGRCSAGFTWDEAGGRQDPDTERGGGPPAGKGERVAARDTPAKDRMQGPSTPGAI